VGESHSSIREFTPPPRFRLLRRLGEGGMGVVYEALDQQRNARVAIKTVRMASADALLRFKREFRTLQELHHRNLASLGELFSEGGEWFFTMELIDGKDLVTYLREQTDAGGALDYDALRRCFAQLAEGLEVLHRAHKVHRDIKPSNVLVTSDGRVVILDFGLVVDLDDANASATGVVGTAAYMAPEQAMGHAVAPPMDLYAVGALLYEALAGRPLFVGNVFEILHRKVVDALSPPRASAPGTPDDLDALSMELLAAEPAARPTARELAARLQGTVRLPSIRPPGASAFIGRDRELAELTQAFERFRRGETALVTVEGESGVGKSALVSRFLEDLALRESDLVVLASRCRECESVPYNAFDGAIDALSRFLLRAASPDAVLPVRVDVVAQAFPVLLAVPAVAKAHIRDPEADAVQHRRLLFGAIRELFARLGQRFTVVLVLDDLQWADVDSLALLAEITREPEPPRVLVLATQRGALAPETRDRIAKAVGEKASRLVLPSLSASESLQLVERLTAGTSLSTSDVARVVREANGHPLFIDELVRYVAGGGTTSGEVRLDDALWARVIRLEPAARDLVTLVAVAGAPIAATVLARAAGLDGGTTATHLELLRSAQLVRGTDPNPTEVFEAYHDRPREAVLANLAPDVRRATHERLARALETDAHPDDEALAMHWREAGDGVRAATFAVRAANTAMAGVAFDHAAELYRLALELDPPSGEAAVALRARLGEALASAGRGAESAHEYLRAAKDAPTDAALSLKERAASQLMRAGHMDEGMAVVRDVLAAVGMSLPSTPLRALLSFLFRRILVRLRGFEFKERAASEISPHRLLVLDLLSSLSFLLSFVDTVRGGDFQARYIVLALDAGEPYRITRALGSEAPYSVSIGMKGWAHAQSITARARALADRIGDARSIAYVTAASGIASYLAGRFKESVRLCDEAFASQAPGVVAERMRARQFACYSLALMGEFAELERRLPEHLRDAEARGDVYLSTNLLVGLPHMTWLVRGDVERARAGVAAAKARWTAEGFTLETYYTFFAELQTELYVGAPDVAWSLLMQRWPALRRPFLLRIQTVRFMAFHARARAAIALAERDPTQRRELLADAEHSAGRLARDRGAWGVPLAALARAGIARLRGSDATALLAAAARDFTRFDLHFHAAVARYAEGGLRGGDAGRALRAEAETFLRAQGTADVERVTALLAPGLAAGTA